MHRAYETIWFLIISIMSSEETTPIILKNRSEVDEDNSPFRIPATPLMKKIGLGTGVGVYRFDRSPRFECIRSPWALKKVNKKKIRGNVGDRLRKEAEILKTLNHPNIIGFRGFVTKNEREVLAMEEGGVSLGDLIEKRRENGGPRFTPFEIIKVIKDISKALHYIHTEKKIIHGDIKSYNVLIKDNFSEVKLCDFGVSHPLDDEGEAEDYIGTECWCAPEVLIGESVTLKADMFSFGLTIWEMLTLQVPHSGDELTDDSFSSVNSQPDPSENYGTRPSIPDNLEPEYTVAREIFLWCTEEEPHKRPTASDILKRVGEKI